MNIKRDNPIEEINQIIDWRHVLNKSINIIDSNKQFTDEENILLLKIYYLFNIFNINFEDIYFSICDRVSFRKFLSDQNEETLLEAIERLSNCLRNLDNNGVYENERGKIIKILHKYNLTDLGNYRRGENHISLVHFSSGKDNLIQILKGGFAFNNNNIDFDVNPEYLLQEINKHSSIFNEKDIERINNKLDGILMFIGRNQFEVPMICFTERTYDKKIARYFPMRYSKFGLILKYDWALKNKVERVVYVDKESELSKKLSVLIGLVKLKFEAALFSLIIDILSFLEPKVSITEFEWRIVGKNIFYGNNVSNSPIPFLLSDIQAIILPDYEYKDEIIAILEEKGRNESNDSLPPIVIYDEIVE